LTGTTDDVIISNNSHTSWMVTNWPKEKRLQQ